MLVDLLATAFFTVGGGGLVAFLIGLLPEGSLDTLPSIDRLAWALSSWDAYIPILGPMRVVITVIGLWSIVLVMRVVVWAWRLLPFT